METILKTFLKTDITNVYVDKVHVCWFWITFYTFSMHFWRECCVFNNHSDEIKFYYTCILLYMKVTMAMLGLAVLVISLGVSLAYNCGDAPKTNGCNVWNIVPYKSRFTNSCNKHDVCYSCVSVFTIMLIFIFMNK